MQLRQIKNKLLQKFYRPYKKNNFWEKSEKLLKELDKEIESVTANIFNKKIKKQNKK